MLRSSNSLLYVCVVAVALGSAPTADNAVQPLPFQQDWANTGLITVSDNWNGVSGITGYRGDGLTTAVGVDPQTVLGDANPVVDVNANQTNPNTFTTGGLTEFHIADPVVAFQGSSTADAPNLIVNISMVGWNSVSVAYNLRDIDGSADNAVQPVALQYRIGEAGNFTNVSSAFVADATTGPNLATLVTRVEVQLPADAGNQPLVQLRIITTDAAGSDEWVGIDDIAITGSFIALPTPPGATGAATPSSVSSGESTLLTVAVTPGANPASTGLTVTADLTSIGGSAAQPFFDDGADGDTTAGDNIFSHRATPIGAPGGRTLPVSVADAQGREATTSIALTITAGAGVVISQIYGGGGNSGATYTHDFIELHNRESADVSVAGWSVQYASATGSSWAITPLTGTIPARGYYLIQQARGSGGSTLLPAPDAIGNIAMAATAGKVALVAATPVLTGTCPRSAAVDFVGYGPTANCFEGSGPTAALSNTTAALRLGDGAIDTNDNAADFIVVAPLPHRTPPSGIGRALPASLPSGASTLLTVATTQGTLPAAMVTQVTGDLTAFGGGVAEPLFDDGTHGDVAAGDAVYSVAVAVTGAPGFRSATFTITDAIGRTGSASVRLAVETALVPISSVQGAGTASLLRDQFVTTSGIVTARRDNGYFIQTPHGLDDGNPLTSEGLFVFTGASNATWPNVGDVIRVSGNVVEFPADAPAGSLTELGGGPVFHATATGQPLPAPVELLPSFTAPTGDTAQLERFEAMRVAAHLRVIAPSRGFRNETTATGTSTGEFYAVIEGVARPVREPGLQPGDSVPSDLPCCVPRFDGNPERLRVLSDRQPGAARLDVATGQRLTGVTGVLDFTFGLYTVLPDPGAVTVAGTIAAAPAPLPRDNEFTVASFNLERFFDADDDPSIDDVVLTADAVERRLSKALLTIRDVMRLPDILGVVEVENRAILEDLAERINLDAVAVGAPTPQYEARLEEGNDVGGIDVGFLVKKARVSVLAVIQEGKNATFMFNGQPRILNDRPPLVLEALVHGPSGAPVPVTVIVNHLRSLLDITEPENGARVRAKRAAQAEFLAQLVQQRQPSQRVIVVGDFNAFQFNDGLVDVMGTITGRPAAANEVAQATLDFVEPNLTNLGDLLGPQGHYSFVFDGNAQALDHILVNDLAHRHVSRMHYARSNADFPESLRGDATRPERLSDHDAAIAYFGFAPMAIEDLAITPATLGAPNHKMVDVNVAYRVEGPSGAASCGLAVTSNESTNHTGDGNTGVDWEILDAHHIRLRAERAGSSSGRNYTVAVTCTDALGNARTASGAVTVAK